MGCGALTRLVGRGARVDRGVVRPVGCNPVRLQIRWSPELRSSARIERAGDQLIALLQSAPIYKDGPGTPASRVRSASEARSNRALAPDRSAGVRTSSIVTTTACPLAGERRGNRLCRFLRRDLPVSRVVCAKSVHAAHRYSWMSPPRRSTRFTPAEAERMTRSSGAFGVGGARWSERCGLCVL